MRAALYQCIEDLACIWADMTLSYYAAERLVPMMAENGALVAEKLDEHSIKPGSLRARVEVVDSSSYSASVTLSILDKLLAGGHITPAQYLKRIPAEYVSNREELLGGDANE